MSPVGAFWAPVALRLLRVTLTKGSRVIRNKLSSATKQTNQIRQISHQTRAPHTHIPRPQRRVPRTKAFNATKQTNWVQTLRRYITTDSGITRFDRSKFPRSETATRVTQQSGRAPFASTLRPNLTGGAIPRTAGGYSLGGGVGVRYFSHTPTAPAQVVNNVSQAMRAFCFSGQRARFDGVDARGNPTFRAVNVDEKKKLASAIKAPFIAPGSYIGFSLSPTVTALTPLSAAVASISGVSSEASQKEVTVTATINSDGVIDNLALDFARAWKDLSIVFSDIKKLSELGDLPITLESNSLIRVRFPGIDAKTVQSLCDDLGICRGFVGEDPEFETSDEVCMALKFPFASTGSVVPSTYSEIAQNDDADMYMDQYLLSPGKSIEDMFFTDEEMNPWLSPIPSDAESIVPKDYQRSLRSSGFHCSDMDSNESITRFLDYIRREQNANRFA